MQFDVLQLSISKVSSYPSVIYSQRQESYSSGKGLSNMLYNTHKKLTIFLEKKKLSKWANLDVCDGKCYTPLKRPSSYRSIL